MGKPARLDLGCEARSCPLPRCLSLQKPRQIIVPIPQRSSTITAWIAEPLYADFGHASPLGAPTAAQDYTLQIWNE